MVYYHFKGVRFRIVELNDGFFYIEIKNREYMYHWKRIRGFSYDYNKIKIKKYADIINEFSTFEKAKYAIDKYNENIQKKINIKKLEKESQKRIKELSKIKKVYNITDKVYQENERLELVHDLGAACARGNEKKVEEIFVKLEKLRK